MSDLLELDYIVFHWVNTEWTNPLLDTIMPLLRKEIFWAPLYVFLMAFSFINFGKKAYWFVLFALLTVGTTDYISSHVVKKSVQRIRPCNSIHDFEVIERVRCGNGFSFTSSHATNHFGLATFLFYTIGTLFRRRRGWLFVWAGAISVAQVYVGVHYPLDIIGGTILGLLLGKFWAILYRKYYPELFYPTH
jgi:membrane-associated phospholipid phosphatase